MSPKRRPSSHPLRGHHTRLVGLFQDLMAEAKKDDRSKLRPMWATFETALLAHINAEETELLPLYRQAHPEEAAGVAKDHDYFRKTLSEFGVDVDLHLMRVDVVEEFIRRLRDHAISEDGGLYAWAAQKVPKDVQERFRKVAEGITLPPAKRALEALEIGLP